MSNWIHLRRVCILFCYAMNVVLWASESMDICEKQQLKYVKIVLNVRNTRPTCMVLGELAWVHSRFPLRQSVECCRFGYELCLDMNAGSGKKISFNIALKPIATHFQITLVEMCSFISKQAGIFLYLVKYLKHKLFS